MSQTGKTGIAGKTGVNEYTGDDAGFVSRWSRRKHESRNVNSNAGAVAEQEQRPEHGYGQKHELKPGQEYGQEFCQKPADKKTAEKILTDADMPDIESMTADSDYTGFLSPGVSEDLRKLALRKLFSSDMFNIRDGLDDYDDDFTSFAKLGSTVTADMRHQIELKAQRMAEQLQQEKQQLPADGHNIGEQLTDADTIETNTAAGSSADDDKQNDTEVTKTSAATEPAIEHRTKDKKTIQNKSQNTGMEA